MRRPLLLLLSLLTTTLLLAWLFGSNQPVRHGDARAEDATVGSAANVVATAEPRPNDGDPLRVLPGRYRAELARRWRSEDGAWRFEPLGITRTVELRAGERTAIRF